MLSPTGAGLSRPLVTAPRLGPDQIEALRRLTGRWLLLAEAGHARFYWCTERGYRVPPYHCVRQSLVASLLDHGYLRRVVVRPGYRHYAASAAGRRAFREAQLKAPSGRAELH